jgi:hypothetical protein
MPHVKLIISHFGCTKPTETNFANDRDEVYIVVSGKSPAGNTNNRFPAGDDYYEFKEGWRVEVRGWTNQNQQTLTPPVLWEGNLEAGQAAHVLVSFFEQDNKTINKVLLLGGLLGSAASNDPNLKQEDRDILRAIADGLQALASLFPEKDEVLGAVILIVRNGDAGLTVEAVPVSHVNSIEREHGPSVITTRFHGMAKSRYNVMFNVE